MTADPRSPLPPSEMSENTPSDFEEVPSLTDALNEFEYVIGNAPDAASRSGSRKAVVAVIGALIATARHRGFRDAERAYFDD